MTNVLRHVPSHSLLRHSTETPAEDRPSYSKDYLTELRNSTPSTPKDLSSYTSSVEEEEDLKALELASKFGDTPMPGPSTGAIPTESEIREKKERRARLAKEHGAEQDYIALEDYDSDGEFKPRRMQVSTYLEKEQDREEDSRLIREDEDVLEGFDDFVEDAGRVTLDKKGKREQRKRELLERREMIINAENSSSESDSEAEANEAYELAQSRAGMDGLNLGEQAVKRGVKKRATRGAREPAAMVKIPRLGDVVRGLKERQKGMEDDKKRMETRVVELDRELLKVKEMESHIQAQLEEAGQEFERMKNALQEKHRGSGPNGLLGEEKAELRGLENLGGTTGP